MKQTKILTLLFAILVGQTVLAQKKLPIIKANSTSVDIKDDLETVDFALGLGAGYVNPGSGFGVDARYNLGLSNINDNSSVKSTNRGFQLGVFYLFGHK